MRAGRCRKKGGPDWELLEISFVWGASWVPAGGQRGWGAGLGRGQTQASLGSPWEGTPLPSSISSTLLGPARPLLGWWESASSTRAQRPLSGMCVRVYTQGRQLTKPVIQHCLYTYTHSSHVSRPRTLSSRSPCQRRHRLNCREGVSGRFCQGREEGAQGQG